MGMLPDFNFDVLSLNPRELNINFDGDPPPLGPLIYLIPYPIKKCFSFKEKKYSKHMNRMTQKDQSCILHSDYTFRTYLINVVLVKI